jgi:predicted transcriptional regulator
MLDKNKLRAIRLLVFTDKTKKEIANELGITEQTLYNWLKEKDFNNLLHSESKVYYSYIRKKTFKKLNSLMMKAFSVIEESLNSDDEKIRVRTAFDLLEVYAHFKELSLLDIRNLDEVVDLVEDSEDTEYLTLRNGEMIKVVSDKGSKALDFLNKDLTELLDYEDEA